MTGERERYLRELERRLPDALGHRRRVLREVDEHLRDGDVARFGDVEGVAAALRGELRIRAAAPASWLIPGLVAAFVIPFYPVPENAFPPAPWAVKPEYLAWKQNVSLGAFLAAIALAASGWAVARARPRLALVPLAASFATFAVAAVFACISAVQWVAAVPGTPAALVYAGIVPASAALVGAVAVVLAEAR